MLKEELVKKISKESRLKRKKTLKVFNKVIELISKDIKKGRVVSIEDFGEFKIKRQEMKILINKSKTKIIIPPKDIIEFELSKKLTLFYESND